MRRRLSRTEASANGRTHNLNLPLETAAMAKTPKTDQHADCDIIRNSHGIALSLLKIISGRSYDAIRTE